MAPPLHHSYPWTTPPLIISAPMRSIALSRLTASVTTSGGIAFLGLGSDISLLPTEVERTLSLLPHPPTTGTLPFGIGLLLWGLTPSTVRQALETLPLPPAGVWFFAPSDPSDLSLWASTVRAATKGRSEIWIQVGSVSEAIEAVTHAWPEVLVVQGQDAGGHGLAKGAGLIPLFPEVQDALLSFVSGSEGRKMPRLVAAGGLTDGRCAAAAVVMGAEGVVLGTALLASPEAEIAEGYRRVVLRTGDGGGNTVRSRVYDSCRGISGWPERYGGRGVVNASYTDHCEGLNERENRELYEEASKMGDAGWDGTAARMTTYAGTGVGLVKEQRPAGEIVESMRRDIMEALRRTSERTRELEAA